MTRYIVATNNPSPSCVISWFRHEVYKNCVLLGYYAASSGNILQTFGKTYRVPSTGCPETSIRNCHNSLSDSSEQRSSQPHSFAFTKQTFVHTSFSLRSVFPQHSQNLIWCTWAYNKIRWGVQIEKFSNIYFPPKFLTHTIRLFHYRAVRFCLRWWTGFSTVRDLSLVLDLNQNYELQRTVSNFHIILY
jgi:hypothetical protein